MKFTSEELFREVQAIFALILKVDGSMIEPKSHLSSDLGVDSVDFWDIVATFEKKFRARISEGEAANLQTVQDVCDILSKKLTGKR